MKKSSFSNEMLRGFFKEFFSRKGQVVSEIFEEKVLKYQEPQRKGVQRGRPVGFGSKKLITAFLASLGWMPKEIFTVLNSFGASYGVIKLWFLEDRFKGAVKEFRDQIAATFVRRLVEFSENMSTVLWDYPDILKVRATFGGWKDYGEETLRLILAAIVDKLNASRSLPMLRSTRFVIDTCFPCQESEGSGKFVEELDRFITIHVLLYFWHKTKLPATILHQSPQKAEWLSNMLLDHARDLFKESSWISFDTMASLEKDGTVVGDDLKFTGEIAYMVGGKIIRHGRRKKSGGSMSELNRG